MVINAINRVSIRYFTNKTTADGKVTEEEIKAIIKEGTEVVKKCKRTRYCRACFPYWRPKNKFFDDASKVGCFFTALF
jgi:hypothetical protein